MDKSIEKYVKNLNSNSLELDLIIETLLSKQDKLNFKDKEILKKQLKKHEEIEERLKKFNR